MLAGHQKESLDEKKREVPDDDDSKEKKREKMFEDLRKNRLSVEKNAKKLYIHMNCFESVFKVYFHLNNKNNI